jgi:hypothetical protein
LHRGPAACEIGTIGRRERADLKLFPAFGKKLQHIFTAVHVTFLLNNSIIFRAETLTERLAAPFSHNQETNDGDHYQDRNGGDDYRELMLIHVPSFKLVRVL